jgi:hypothetical protein
MAVTGYLRLLRAAVGGATAGTPAPPAGAAGAGAFFGFLASLFPFLDMVVPMLAKHPATADAMRMVDVLLPVRSCPFASTQPAWVGAGRGQSRIGGHLPHVVPTGIEYVSGTSMQIAVGSLRMWR